MIYLIFLISVAVSLATTTANFRIEAPMTIDDDGMHTITVSGGANFNYIEDYLLRNYLDSFRSRNLASIEDIGKQTFELSPGSFEVCLKSDYGEIDPLDFTWGQRETSPWICTNPFYPEKNCLKISVYEAYFKTGMAPIDKRLVLTGRSEALTRLFDEVWLTMYTKKDDTIHIIQNGGRPKEILKRPMQTVYLPEGLGESLIEDIQHFRNNLALYRKFSIPYRRGYMLSGPPGTGKTTLVHALASHFDASINVISIEREMNKGYFMWVLEKVQENSFVLIEDVDALYQNREGRGDLSFSDFINIIDGLSSKEGIVLFMTTNHEENIDPALLRPGRADRHVSMGFANRGQVLAIFTAYLPDQLYLFDLFYYDLPENITTATLQKFFFLHLNCTNILEHKHELTGGSLFFD